MASKILHQGLKRSPATLLPSRYSRNPAIARRTLIATLPRSTEGDLGNPQATSSKESSAKTSRATAEQNSPDTASVAQPVSDRNAMPDNRDDGTPAEGEIKRDPKEPAEEKRKHVEKQGEKPLGQEDHQ